MNRNYSFFIGRSAALMILIETIFFAVSIIWEILCQSVLAKNLGYAASFFLAISVVIMMASYYEVVSEKVKIFGLLALASSIIYATFCVGTYYLQLTTVAFNPLSISGEVMATIIFKPGSPIFSLDMLGYGFLCLSTLAAGFALTEAKDKILRILCFFHGALVIPTLASPIISGLFLSTNGQTNDVGSYVLLFWSFVFIPIALLFAKYFGAEKRTK